MGQYVVLTQLLLLREKLAVRNLDDDIVLSKLILPSQMCLLVLPCKDQMRDFLLSRTRGVSHNIKLFYPLLFKGLNHILEISK